MFENQSEPHQGEHATVERLRLGNATRHVGCKKLLQCCDSGPVSSLRDMQLAAGR